MAKSMGRVNGRNGESMWVEDEQLCFRSGSKVNKMPQAGLTSLAIENIEDARKAITDSSLAPLGVWTNEMSSSGGKSMFVVAQDADNVWVMEITKNQVPNATTFVQQVQPKEKGDGKVIPGRAIDTPLGGLFAIGSILCVFGATFLVFSFERPILGLIVAVAGILMWVNAK